MKNLSMIAGLLGIFVSLAAQLLAINDDDYHFGNIWFIGVLGGIIGTWAAFSININNKKATVLLIISLLLGFAGIGSLYSISAFLQFITLIYLAYKHFHAKGDKHK
ncbi:hypothetical protein ACPVTF_02270 [Geobacillus icigianus]|uniref:Membrane protein YnxB n=2 Tax=Geobacillus TaxID=129337 RepID=A0A679G060_9BACL|nr:MULTISPECIES: hypothetical protein [Geobacillus]MEB3752713.1 hypothetical protein [Geobacillus icigianus]MED3778884.1 hypothetical protein [Geobacillus stearothermophilus]MED4961109.1 hypothetical protein [Geobacillus stearothermophilus]BBW98464.1 putative membrane protein YnxB [Geobacillus subterraneus]